MTGTRDDAIAAAHSRFDSGRLLEELTARVGMQTVSTDPTLAQETERYFRLDLGPTVEGMGFTWQRFDNPCSDAHPFFVAERIEADAAFTILLYGHADVQPPQTDQWRDGLDPWHLTVEGERWYGRGTADNKAQHTINLASLDEVISVTGGNLGYNVKLLIESGEEAGSPGLSQFCSEHQDALSSDVFLASDGPRMSADSPTMFLGSRGTSLLRLEVSERDRSYHSGNWGGVLSNAGTVLANALAALVDQRGRILVDALRPTDIAPAIRSATDRLSVGTDQGDPPLSESWGEPGLTPAERLFAWNTLEILDFFCGDPHQPVGAIPASAHADLQFRYVVGSTTADAVAPAIRAHLHQSGIDRVTVTERGGMSATRLNPEHPWAQFVSASLTSTIGQSPSLLPNLAGTIPNGAFADVLGLPTVWIPHSYPGCAQHAPNEHVLAPLTREAMGIMAGLFWDLRFFRP